ncbi:MarR family transcriptional regulator [Bosea sp. CS1GBMeth4]|uniref:MarR family winged helix-turn-helix transcriptional regulator n=1 Tax=Bosea sp. CS1GBMeth4 TaxID=1892849 RepID=UPI001FCE8870|nr:MarR family transcriptional regulator [Bosea sp. CS1GBMeth4]
MTTGKAAAGATLKLDDFLCFAVYTAGHAFNRLYKPLLDALGLTYPQYLAMVALWEKDDRTVGELGEQLFLESNTLTPLLKRLEGMELVARVRDKADERQVRLRLTAAGKALRAKAETVPPCVLDATGMTAAEAQALTGAVTSLRDTLLRKG